MSERDEEREKIDKMFGTIRGVMLSEEEDEAPRGNWLDTVLVWTVLLAGAVVLALAIYGGAVLAGKLTGGDVPEGEPTLVAVVARPPSCWITPDFTTLRKDKGRLWMVVCPRGTRPSTRSVVVPQPGKALPAGVPSLRLPQGPQAVSSGSPTHQAGATE